MIIKHHHLISFIFDLPGIKKQNKEKLNGYYNLQSELHSKYICFPLQLIILVNLALLNATNINTARFKVIGTFLQQSIALQNKILFYLLKIKTWLSIFFRILAFPQGKSGSFKYTHPLLGHNSLFSTSYIFFVCCNIFDDLFLHL